MTRVPPYRLPPGTDELLALSSRERDVFVRLANCESIGEIAERTGLSPSTVSTYRGRIVKKTGFKTDVEMAHYAIARGLVILRHIKYPALIDDDWAPLQGVHK